MTIGAKLLTGLASWCWYDWLKAIGGVLVVTWMAIVPVGLALTAGFCELNWKGWAWLILGIGLVLVGILNTPV